MTKLAYNRRPSILPRSGVRQAVTIDGEQFASLAEVSRRFGVNYHTLYDAWRMGFRDRDLITSKRSRAAAPITQKEPTP